MKVVDASLERPAIKELGKKDWDGYFERNELECSTYCNWQVVFGMYFADYLTEKTKTKTKTKKQRNKQTNQTKPKKFKNTNSNQTIGKAN